MQISEEILEKIKSQNDIVDVISERVRLKKAGRNFTGLCPFHNEKTPSFSVSQEKQIYKCFGCGEAGNVISFVMKDKNLPFIEAVKYLANRANIPLKLGNGEQSQSNRKKELLYKVNVEAAKFFFSNLMNNQNAKEYFLNRGIKEETIKKYNETLENARKTYQEQLEKKEITQKQYDKKMASLVDISTLPKCGEFSVTDSGYEGIWTTIFVKPLAWLILKIGGLVKNYGVSVVIITILIRLCMYPITKKTALQSERMNEVKPELERLEKKYKNKTDQQSMVMKSQETMLLYKKYGINPISGCVFAFIQIPLFFAFYEALNRLPAIFEGKFLGLELGTTAGTAILNGKVYYLLVVVLVVLDGFVLFPLDPPPLGLFPLDPPCPYLPGSQLHPSNT